MKGKNFSLKSNKRNKNDYYQTPYGMTRQLLEVENFGGKILEPSCGAGAIVKVLRDYNKSVDYCDLNNGILHYIPSENDALKGSASKDVQQQYNDTQKSDSVF